MDIREIMEKAAPIGILFVGGQDFGTPAGPTG